MTGDLENSMTDLCGDLREIRSAMVILQSAVENEFSTTEPIDIEHHLSIIIEKLDSTLSKTKNLYDMISKN